MPVYYIEDVRKVFNLPLPTLVYHAQEVQQRMLVTDGIVVRESAEYDAEPRCENVEACLQKLIELSNADTHPETLALDALIPCPPADLFDWVRLTALARVMLPKTLIRIPADCGNDAVLALCCCAGANALSGENPAFVNSLKMRNIDFEEHHKKVHGCKGDGSCGHCTCGKHDHHH